MTMRAVRITQFGGPESLKLDTNTPIPKPAADEVLVKIKAAGINPVDTYIRTGTFDNTQVPYTPGRDGAGIIEAVGESVNDFKKGDRVLVASAVSGSYAEYCTAKSLRVCPLHDSLSFNQGAAIGIPYYTAYTSIINKANTIPGETVLVHGASGAVGIAACQILKAHGCTVIGTAGTPEGMKVVIEAGADKVFNHREEGYMEKIFKEVTDGKGVDVIMEMLSNVNLQKDLEIVAKRGRIVIIGCRGQISIDPRLMMVRESTVTGVMLGAATDNEWKVMHAAIHAGQRIGWLKPRVAKVYSLNDASTGHHDVIHKPMTEGKLVIDTSL